MGEILLLVVAVWGSSAVIMIVMYTLDERTHRRRSVVPQTPVVAKPSINVATRPARSTHADHALI